MTKKDNGEGSDDDPDDDEVIEGGPEGSAEGGDKKKKAPAASDDAGGGPKLVTVNYGGKTFKVSPETAEVIRAQQAEIEKARKKSNTQQDDPPPRKQTTQQRPEEPAGGEDEDLIFTDPKKWAAQLRKQIRDEVVSEVSEAYSADQAQKRFWDTFKAAHPDLVDDLDIAERLLNSNFNEWKKEGISIKETMTRVADLTRDRLDRITSRSDPNSRKKKKVSEGASGRQDEDRRGRREHSDEGDEGEDEGDQPKIRTTAQILRARREARERLRTGATKH